MNKKPKLLNLGCGNNFHAEWTNLDLVPRSQHVQRADLSKGIPFEECSADAVYHSHVLEHLTKDQGEVFVSECFRVLRPGGVLRIAVPDLEQITRQYLSQLEAAWRDPNQINLAKYDWMKLELIDQMVRSNSGGEMGKIMCDPNAPGHDFVKTRLGYEVSNSNQTPSVPDQESANNLEQSVAKKTSYWSRKKNKLKRKIIRLFYGKEFLAQIDKAEFRASGEIHQWMYDRVSIRKLLTDAGFEAFQVCTAFESRIPDFARYQLDSTGSGVKKPDSIFVEVLKPNRAAVAA